MVCHYTKDQCVVSFSSHLIGWEWYYINDPCIMAHHSTTVWYRFKLPFQTVVLPFETVVLLFRNGSTSVWNGSTPVSKRNHFLFETGLVPFWNGSTTGKYRNFRILVPFSLLFSSGFTLSKKYNFFHLSQYKGFENQRYSCSIICTQRKDSLISMT